MPIYNAPLEDYKFLLHQLFAEQKLDALPGFEEAAPELIDAILEEGGRVCGEVFFPLNMSGDHEGCTFKDGEVTAPKGFKDAYQTYCEGGWAGLSAPQEYGGQGLPQTINTIMAELISAANLSFGMYPGLSQGAMNAIRAVGSEEQKQMYLPNMITGEWTGTMNLTEPQCGTDLGLIRTKAELNEDGSYAISGTKIYISAGEHDLSENIIHLVLARLPDAPKGVHGISLFIVPKFIVKDDQTLGERNAANCGSIEEKMGIHASPTCVMNYEEAKGWLIGEPHKGLKAMFIMMNEARLHVGMQGLGLADVAYQNALSYAKERLQGRALKTPAQPEKPADPILVHPDVRRMLLVQKANIEACRALAVRTGLAIDVAHNHADKDERQKADDFVALMTPIIKAYFTDMAFDCTNLAVQVHGGAGYIREYAVEQYVRDARITQIYEGTNGIQALDLVGRKMGKHTGRYLRSFFHPMQKELEAAQANPTLAELTFPLMKAFAKLQQATATIAQKGMANPDEGAAAATDYLRLFSLVALGREWLAMASLANKAIEAGDFSNFSKDFYQSKIDLAHFFAKRMLPEANARFTMLMSGAETIKSL